MVKTGMTGWNRSERGAAAVEFALVLPILLLVVGGAIEFGRAFWFYDSLSKVTRDAARYLTMVNCNSGESVSNCALRLGNVVANAKGMVTAAATDAHLTDFGAGNVEVRCDGSVCTSNAAVLASTNVTVAIVDYGIRLGEWLPIGYLGEPAGYNLGIQPYTTMRYMGR
jgi:Flp pilus assembly protein TadG